MPEVRRIASPPFCPCGASVSVSHSCELLSLRHSISTAMRAQLSPPSSRSRTIRYLERQYRPCSDPCRSDVNLNARLLANLGSRTQRLNERLVSELPQGRGDDWFEGREPTGRFWFFGSRHSE